MWTTSFALQSRPQCRCVSILVATPTLSWTTLGGRARKRSTPPHQVAIKRPQSLIYKVYVRRAGRCWTACCSRQLIETPPGTRNPGRTGEAPPPPLSRTLIRTTVENRFGCVIACMGTGHPVPSPRPPDPCKNKIRTSLREGQANHSIVGGADGNVCRKLNIRATKYLSYLDSLGSIKAQCCGRLRWHRRLVSEKDRQDRHRPLPLRRISLLRPSFKRYCDVMKKFSNQEKT